MLWRLRKDDELLETIMPLVELNRPEAKLRLARMYADGRGVEKDLEKAEALMAEAAKKKPKFKADYDKLVAKINEAEEAD